MDYIQNTFLRHLVAIVSLFIFGIVLVWAVTFFITSIMAFIYLDFSLYNKVIPYLDPRNFTWMRVCTLIWVVFSIYFGRLLGELG